MSIFELESIIPLDFTINTDRCRLRCPSAADIPDIFSVTRFAGFNDGMQWEPPDSIDELDQPLRDNLADWVAGTTYCLTIADPITDRLIGRIGIRRTNTTKPARSERANVLMCCSWGWAGFVCGKLYDQ